MFTIDLYIPPQFIIYEKFVIYTKILKKIALLSNDIYIYNLDPEIESEIEGIPHKYEILIGYPTYNYFSKLEYNVFNLLL